MTAFPLSSQLWHGIHFVTSWLCISAMDVPPQRIFSGSWTPYRTLSGIFTGRIQSSLIIWTRDSRPWRPTWSSPAYTGMYRVFQKRGISIFFGTPCMWGETTGKARVRTGGSPTSIMIKNIIINSTFCIIMVIVMGPCQAPKSQILSRSIGPIPCIDLIDPWFWKVFLRSFWKC